MKNFFYALLLLCVVVLAQAQSYSPGLPLPGLPKSLGPKTMANSTSVTIASNQTPITITGNITANNQSIGTPGLPMPVSATAIGVKDQSGNLQFLPIGPSGVTVSAVATIPGGVGVTNTVTAFIPSGVGITNTVTAFIPSGVGITNTPSVFIPAGVGITNTPSVFIPAGVGITNTPNVAVPNGVAITATYSVATSTVSRVANSASNQTLLSSNASRKALFLYNDDSTTTDYCLVKFGATASATSFAIKMFATDTYIMDQPIYTGQLDYICNAASGSMEVNEQ